MFTGTVEHVAIPAVIFLGLHVFLSGTPLRGVVVGAIGTRAYLSIFSLASLGALVWMILAYREAPFIEIWHLPSLAWIGIIVMPFAFLGAVAGNTTKNPPPSHSAAEDGQPDDVANGIFKITRHPFLWSVVLWSASHLLVNGDQASLWLFGTFLALGLIGPHLIDAKFRKRDREEWERFAAGTSYVPFAALVGGRARVKLAEIGWWRILAAAALYAVFLAGHGWIFGVPILAPL